MARMGEYKWWGNMKIRDHLEELGIGERIILKWVLKKQDGSMRAAYVWLKSGRSGRAL